MTRSVGSSLRHSFAFCSGNSLRFSSQEALRTQNSTDFLEFQFCQLPCGTPLSDIVQAEFCHWQLSSLYVSGDDFSLFWEIYADVFGPGVYANLQDGDMDYCGVNYYDSARTDAIVLRLIEKKPPGFQRLLNWLRPRQQYNGFYVLGA